MLEVNKITNPQELLEFMNNNIIYGFVGKNGKKYTNPNSEEWDDWYQECMVQSGEEVIISGIGTCWDQVELERLWFEKSAYPFKTFFCWFEVNRENDLPTHTFLIYEDNNKYYWFEHSFGDYCGIHEYPSLELAIEDIKNKQFNYALSYSKTIKQEDINTFACYEYSKPKPHLGVDDYINFVTSKNKIKRGF